LTLKSRDDIDRLFASGKRLPGDFITLIWVPEETFRYGVFVGKRYGKAYQRNKFKRLVRESIRLNQPALQVPGWVGILPRGTEKQTGLKQINSDVCRIFTRLTGNSQ